MTVAFAERALRRENIQLFLIRLCVSGYLLLEFVDRVVPAGDGGWVFDLSSLLFTAVQAFCVGLYLLGIIPRLAVGLLILHECLLFWDPHGSSFFEQWRQVFPLLNMEAPLVLVLLFGTAFFPRHLGWIRWFSWNALIATVILTMNVYHIDVVAFVQVALHVYPTYTYVILAIFTLLMAIPLSRFLMAIAIFSLLAVGGFVAGLSQISLIALAWLISIFDGRILKPKTPAADDARPILFFDGVCSLCNWTIDELMSVDSFQHLRFASLQGATARRLLPPQIFESKSSLVLCEKGRIYQRSDGALHVLRYLGGGFWFLMPLQWIPKFFRDSIYDVISRNRYRWFGTRETCRLPTETDSQQLLD